MIWLYGAVKMLHQYPQSLKNIFASPPPGPTPTPSPSYDVASDVKGD